MTGLLPSRDRFVHAVDVLTYDTEATDPRGALTLPGSVTATAVPCLIVDKGGSRVPAFGKEQERKRARVLFPDPIELRQGHALRYTTPAGKVRIFTVDSCRDDVDLGRLWVAECQEFPDPTE